MDAKEINKKFQKGDALSDNELSFLLKKYELLRDNSDFLTSELSLFRSEIYRCCYRLEDYIRARAS